jgi:hypothetical protein
MKLPISAVPVVLLLAGLSLLHGQEAPDEFANLSPAWHQEYSQSLVLAHKLFPQLGDVNSQMYDYVSRINFALKSNNSDVYSYADKPLVMALFAGSILKVRRSGRNLQQRNSLLQWTTL